MYFLENKYLSKLKCKLLDILFLHYTCRYKILCTGEYDYASFSILYYSKLKIICELARLAEQPRPEVAL